MQFSNGLRFLFEARNLVILSLSVTLSALAIFIFLHLSRTRLMACSYKIKMCSNNAPIVAIIHGLFFFSFFYFQKGFQRNQMCVINNFHKLRRSVGTQCFFTFLRHSVPTERNKRIQIYSTRITFLRNDF